MISKEQIEELVRLYDQFHGAFDPLLPEVLEAERAFFEKLFMPLMRRICRSTSS